MAASRPELLRRVAQVLLDLELLSEAPASQGFDARPRIRAPTAAGGSPAGPSGPRGGTRLEWQLAGLGRWCEGAERDVESSRRGPRVEAETRVKFRARVVDEHRGTHYKQVAVIERISESLVRKFRREAGVRETYGLPVESDDQLERRSSGWTRAR